jgi:hypothetical protein
MQALQTALYRYEGSVNKISLMTRLSRWLPRWAYRRWRARRCRAGAGGAGGAPGAADLGVPCAIGVASDRPSAVRSAPRSGANTP